MFTTAVNQFYSRFPDDTHPQRLKLALNQHAEGRITDRELEHALERATVDAVAEMISAGVEVVTSGCIHQQEGLEWIFSRLGDFVMVQPGSEAENMTLKFHPMERIFWKRPLVELEYRFLAERSPVEVRPALTGPFSLSLICEEGCYGSDRRSLTMDLARALNRELEGLEQAGASRVLIEEPLLTSHKNSPADFVEASHQLVGNSRLELMLGTTGGDLTGLEHLIPDLPYQGISLDLCAGPENERLITDTDIFKDLTIQLGLVDSFSSRVEPAMEITLNILRLARHLDPGQVWVAPSAGLERLSRADAFSKLQNLSQGAEWARREMARREGLQGDMV